MLQFFCGGLFGFTVKALHSGHGERMPACGESWRLHMWKEKSAEFLRKNMKNSVLVEISINLKYDNGYSLYNSHPSIYGAVGYKMDGYRLVCRIVKGREIHEV